ncbi:MAG: Ig-like domain-containing protein [Thermoanaerobaculia bacterium]
MMRVPIAATVAMFGWLSVAAAAQTTQTVTLTTGADTYLLVGPPNSSHGTETHLDLEKNSRTRVLVYFDPAAIRAAVGSGTLTHAELRLYAESNNGGFGASGRDVDAHRLEQAWTENGATWNCANDTHPDNQQRDCAGPDRWNGGNFEGDRSATAKVTNQTLGWWSLDLTGDVGAILRGSGAGHQDDDDDDDGDDDDDDDDHHGAAQHGWLIQQRGNQGNAKVVFASRQGTVGRAPQLVLTFMPGGGGGDTVPPVITVTAPAEGAVLATASPTLTATFSDDSSGVDAASVRLTLDGTDRTAQAQITTAGLSFTPPAPLAEGAHSAEVVVRDLAGNEARLTRTFTTDTVAPELSFLEPSEPVLGGSASVHVTLAFPDVASAADTATLQVEVDGASLLPRCSLSTASASCDTAALAGGQHSLTASVRDRAGNAATASFSFELQLDTTAPTVSLAAPAAGSFTHDAQATVAGTVSDDTGVVRVTLNGVPVTFSGGAFSTPLTLAEGVNSVRVEAFDAAGNVGTAAALVTLDTHAPSVVVKSPAAGQLINLGTVRVTGEASDDRQLASVEVAGVPASLTGGRFEAEVPLVEGVQNLVARATDRAGNQSTASVSVRRFTLLEVVIASPQNLDTLAGTTVEVRGSTSTPATSVRVNGVEASLAGTQFTAVGVPLIEGGNLLTATASDAAGRVGTATVTVVRDLTAPHVTIDQPEAGAVLSTPTVTVVGLVNDIVDGTVNASEATVTVNGVPAVVANRSYLASGVPLAPGSNTLTVEALDQGGNRAQASIQVERAEPTGKHLVLVSGDGQQGVIRGALPAPLVVELEDGGGAPLAGQQVIFQVSSGNGLVDGGKPATVVATGPDGRAMVHFTLGSRAGAGNQRVTASGLGAGGPVVFTATALAAPASQIFVDAGNQQVGITGQLLPMPFIAAVTDSGFNRLPGVAVRFRVLDGEGHFENGLSELVVATDSDGRAIAPFALGPEEAVAGNVVSAVIDAPPAAGLVTFSATGWAAGEPAATAIAGQVLDNQDQPIPGVTLRILDTTLTAQTDARGLFRLGGAPVGTVRLVVDGSTATRPGSWPDLEFVVTTVPGRENTVGMPIYLLPLDVADGVFVDETHGGRLTLPEIPGFSLEIAAGSVSFPGGGRSGLVSVTAVHSDKVPMVPNFGQQPRLIVTIQPAGARFDPPARLTLPNVDGLAPGEVTEFYSFDHDLGHFVSIGPATVSRDGSIVVSNPGVGIVKAGWHCGGSPSGSGTTHDCPECQRCDGSNCVPDPGSDGQQCGGDACMQCRGGSCGPTQTKVMIDSPDDNPSPSDADFATNFSFLSGDTVTGMASLDGQGDPSKIMWTLTEIYGDVANVSPADRMGPTLSFEVRQEPPEPQPYVRGTGCGNPGNGSCARATALSYQLEAAYCSSGSDSATITQDQLDIIRQEYINNGLGAPGRGEFRTPTAQANYGPGDVLTTAYSVVLGSPEVLAQNVYNEFNRLIHDDQQLAPLGTRNLAPTAPVVGPGANVVTIGPVLSTRPCNGGPAGCDDQVMGNNIVAGPNGIAETVAQNRVTAVRPTINSAWRNPQRNEAVNGVQNSRHQFGNAIDLNPGGGAEGLTRTQIVCILEQAGDNIATGIAEHLSTQRLCNASDITHVHVQQ